MEDVPTWLQAFKYIRDEPSFSPVRQQDRYEDDAVSEAFLGVSTAVEQADTALTAVEDDTQSQYDTALQHNTCKKNIQLEHGATWGTEAGGGFYVDLGPKHRVKRTPSDERCAEAAPTPAVRPRRTANVFVKLPEDYTEEQAQEQARNHQRAHKQQLAQRPTQEPEQQVPFNGDPMDWDPVLVEEDTAQDEAREGPGHGQGHDAVHACGHCASLIGVTGQLAARLREHDVSSRAQWERIWQLERLVWEQNCQLQEQQAALAAACQWMQWQQWMCGSIY
ncbi:hypothetical protein JDV02_007205 [Purpureocillium takamizusanense]|uniref:Uncharacterized protein n=1 Tax=Purpureocillium takamizusanense TaxID=2060973 RepID=A0A9Q8QM16_9HYPO|nr:uncharacterized protein JDV02_007205 [Purpureocillium takamizusanense]UNI21194.1 hypothetical protein JDV02_007205 [Purpureocillium takamizusanense]